MTSTGVPEAALAVAVTVTLLDPHLTASGLRTATPLTRSWAPAGAEKVTDGYGSSSTMFTGTVDTAVWARTVPP